MTGRLPSTKSLNVWGTKIKVPTADQLKAAVHQYAMNEGLRKDGSRFATPIRVEFTPERVYAAGFTAPDGHVYGAGVMNFMGNATFQRADGSTFDNTLVAFMRFGGTDGKTNRLEARPFRAPPTRASSREEYDAKIAQRKREVPFPPELEESMGTGTMRVAVEFNPRFTPTQRSNNMLFPVVFNPLGWWGR